MCCNVSGVRSSSSISTSFHRLTHPRASWLCPRTPVRQVQEMCAIPQTGDASRLGTCSLVWMRGRELRQKLGRNADMVILAICTDGSQLPHVGVAGPCCGLEPFVRQRSAVVFLDDRCADHDAQCWALAGSSGTRVRRPVMSRVRPLSAIHETHGAALAWSAKASSTTSENASRNRFMWESE